MKKYIIALFIVMSSVTSCMFENDMDYPLVDSDILAFNVEGQKTVFIDESSRQVHIVLEETADIRNVRILSVELSESAKIVGDLPEYIDFTDTLCLNVKVYEDAIWKVYATQPILRYVKVENQIGDAEIDLQTGNIIVYVPDNQQLSELRFQDVKLAPEGSVIRSTTGQDGSGELYTQGCNFPMILDCVHRRTFLTYYDGPVIEERGLKEWTLKVLKKKVDQAVTDINAWCYHAKVYASHTGTGSPVIEYRKLGTAEWTEAPDAVIAGVGLSVDITGLEDETEYEVRLADNGVYSEIRTFVTESPVQLYNMNFDDWYLDGKIYYPYAKGSDPSVWDSANPGAATFIGSSTTPEEGFVVKGKAARLESKYAVIAFAAGNIYTGQFGKIAGVGAELDWGVPFEGRPAALKGYYSYSPQTINYSKAPHEDKMGQTDKCQILVCLTDWTAPFRINTTAGEFVDFDNDPSIIAFAKMESDENTKGQYKSFELPLEYRDKTRKPKYVVIACCASYLGDYFTGGVGSTMHIDEFEFIYQ